MGLAHFSSQFPCLEEQSVELNTRRAGGRNLSGRDPHLHVPQPELGAVVRAARYQIRVVGAPGQIGNPIGMTLQRLQLLELVRVLPKHLRPSDSSAGWKLITCDLDYVIRLLKQ